MNREKKIGLAVIFGLLLLLGGSVVWQLVGGRKLADADDRVSATDSQKSDAADSLPAVDEDLEKPRLESDAVDDSPVRPTVLKAEVGEPLVPETSEGDAEPRTWKTSGESTRTSDPRMSFMPKEDRGPEAYASSRAAESSDARGYSSSRHGYASADAPSEGGTNPLRAGQSATVAPSPDAYGPSQPGHGVGADASPYQRHTPRRFGALDQARGMESSVVVSASGAGADEHPEDAATATAGAEVVDDRQSAQAQQRWNNASAYRQSIEGGRSGHTSPGGYARQDAQLLAQANPYEQAYGAPSQQNSAGAGVTPPAAQSPTRTDGRVAERAAPSDNVGPIRENQGHYYAQPGDNYWTIAARVYGDGRFFRALEAVNRRHIRDGDRLAVGEKIDTPTMEQLREKFGELCPKQRNRKPGTPTARTVSTSRIRPGRTYLIEEGDTLYDIARYELGDATRWPEIYLLNRETLSEDIDFVRPGTQIVLPAQAEERDSLTQQSGRTLR